MHIWCLHCDERNSEFTRISSSTYSWNILFIFFSLRLYKIHEINVVYLTIYVASIHDCESRSSIWFFPTHTLTINSFSPNTLWCQFRTSYNTLFHATLIYTMKIVLSMRNENTPIHLCIFNSTLIEKILSL